MVTATSDVTILKYLSHIRPRSKITSRVIQITDMSYYLLNLLLICVQIVEKLVNQLEFVVFKIE